MNGTNYEYGICEAYFTLKTLCPENANIKSIDINKKFSEIYTTMLGVDISAQLTSGGITFGQLNLAN